MDSIGDLVKDKRPKEPPQLAALRDYVQKNYDSKSQSSVSSMGYTLTVPNSGIASRLQMEKPQIQRECALDKKLFIRIGHIE